MYLSRLILNPRSRQVLREFSNPYQLHRTIMAAFPAQLPGDERVLFRLDIDPRTGFPNLLVQSAYVPDWSALVQPGKSYLQSSLYLPSGWENPAVKSFQIAVSPGQNLVFRLRANPTLKKKVQGKENGRRVGIYREEEQIHWLKRKLDQAGCSLLSVQVAKKDRIKDSLYRGSEKHSLEFLSVCFDGTLLVNDPCRLAEAVKNGIGSGKGLGFGLLSLARK